MALSKREFDSLKPKSKEYSVTDGGGLNVKVLPDGRKIWFLMYRRGKRQRKFTFGEISPTDARQQMLEAKAKPSKVLVPRPISSINTKLLDVALCKIVAVSIISTIKVECPADKSSFAPMRVKIRSNWPMVADCAGIKEPMWANKIIKAFCRIKVDLPPILGPVIINRF